MYAYASTYNNNQRLRLAIGLSLLVTIWLIIPRIRGAYKDTTASDWQITSEQKHSVLDSVKQQLAKFTGDGNVGADADEGEGRQKATLLMLVRNKELKGALTSMSDVEARFNHRFNYPWTFMNDEPFSDEFKNQTSALASGGAEYAVIPKEHWSIPDHTNNTLMDQNMNIMTKLKVPYAKSISYRHMCRFNSGFFFQEPILNKYAYYWRVEPGIEFFCDIPYDVFDFMHVNNKKYGWVISLGEHRSTIPTLWATIQEFFGKNPQYLAKDNIQDFLVDQKKGISGEYNTCHFWSNFEIASLDWFRSKAYVDYFNYLDDTRGFFHERWGDAPVHSIAAALMLNKSEIHRFDDIGYKHAPFGRYPQDKQLQQQLNCAIPAKMDNFDLRKSSCLPKWNQFFVQGKGNGGDVM